MLYTSDMPPPPASDRKQAILDRIETALGDVWTPSDFADLGSRAVVDKTLQRLVAAGELRRIDRGLYDRPQTNGLTALPTVPDYRAVIRAVARRDQARILIDGMTAANDLGLTTAVPARIEAFVDARLRPISLGAQDIRFRATSSKRLYWADRPAMRVVQALHWLQHDLGDAAERARIHERLRALLDDGQHGPTIRDDLRVGRSALPIWMQEFLRPLLTDDVTSDAQHDAQHDTSSDAPDAVPEAAAAVDTRPDSGRRRARRT